MTNPSRYYLFRAPEVLINRLRDDFDVEQSINFMTDSWVRGEYETGKPISSIEKASGKYDIIFDDWNAEITVIVPEHGAVTGTPTHPCPCGGTLSMTRKFGKFGNKNAKWQYDCSNKSHPVQTCKIKVAARVNGPFLYLPADNKTVDARKKTSQKIIEIIMRDLDIESPDKAKNLSYRIVGAIQAANNMEKRPISSLSIEDLRPLYAIFNKLDKSPGSIGEFASSKS